MSAWPTNIQYFRELGVCRCGKPATGWLIGPRNAPYGVACEPCSRKALKAARRTSAAAVGSSTLTRDA